MHPSSAFAWTDVDAMREFVGATAFARIFLATPAGPRVAHAPLLVTGESFRFHLANMNALTPHLDGATALALVEGPNAYLSASWYADVAGQVPSWNYVAVEIDGRVRRLDRAALVDLLDLASATLEPRVGENWTRAKMDPARFDALTAAITGFELVPGAWRGTIKLSQNKPAAEFARVLAAMDRTAPAVAAAMRRARG